MKTFSLRTLSVVLILAAHLFAQRFVAGPPDIFLSGQSSYGGSSGYVPYTQSAALGEKNSSYANLMLFSGNTSPNNSFKVVDSHGAEYGDMQIALATDNIMGAVAVLDSFANNKKAAIVAFASNSKIIISELTITSTNSITSKKLKEVAITENTSNPKSPDMRMTLIGIEKTGNDKIYHIALGNPYYNNGIYANAGHVSFYSIRENQWTLTQPNTTGISFVGANVEFGHDLVAINDLDGNGYNELAVLAPSSTQFPNGAIYIYFMDNYYTPSLTKQSILTGTAMPWIDDKYKDYKNNCNYMSFVVWNNESHLLLSCSARLNAIFLTYIKDIILDENGNIASTNIFSENEYEIGHTYQVHVSTNSIPIKNHKNGKFALAQSINASTVASSQGYIYVYQIQDIDASKNFSIEVGREEAVINIDSLFYKSGTVGYVSKTIAGAAQCNVNNADELVCEVGENASGSWSSVELSSKSACSLYKACKRKDTVHVYARTNLEPANTALRIPKDIIIPWQTSFSLNDLNSLAYFSNPKDLNTNASFDSDKLKFSAIFNNSIIPGSQREGIDTLTFNLTIGATTNHYPVRLHIIDDEKIQKGEMQDTIWNTAKKKYIELPLLNANGNSYTYDIPQSGLNSYVEITGNYLRILKVDFAEISIAYTEEGQIKKRNLILMPEAKPIPKEKPKEDDKKNDKENDRENDKQGDSKTSILSGIELNEEFDFIAYNLKGVEVQRGKAYSVSSLSKILKQKGPQAVRIKNKEGRIFYITVYGNI